MSDGWRRSIVNRASTAATCRADKEVMLVGQFNKFELWDETTWHQQVKEDIDAEQLATGDLSERLQDLSL